VLLAVGKLAIVDGRNRDGRGERRVLTWVSIFGVEPCDVHRMFVVAATALTADARTISPPVDHERVCECG